MPGSVITVRRDQADTFLARIYLWEIAKGCVITARHFFRNLFGYIVGKRRTFVVNWPEEKVEHAPAFRGMPVLVQMENGAERTPLVSILQVPSCWKPSKSPYTTCSPLVAESFRAPCHTPEKRRDPWASTTWKLSPGKAAGTVITVRFFQEGS